MRDSTRTGATQGSQAVVIGASMAGLLAARVLIDHFDQVTIIERDTLLEGPEARQGVPQARHVHGLLKQGSDLLQGWFPGLPAELTAAGAHCLDMSADARWWHAGGWKTRAPSGITCYVQSRALLEWTVRRQLLARPGVRVLSGHAATRLLASADQQAVTGVAVQPHGVGDAPEQILPATLVVDASGRGSRMPQWLTTLGYPAVEESHVTVNIGYGSRIYTPPAGAAPDWGVMLVYPQAPDEQRLGAIFRLEDGNWLVTLGGWHRDYPPTDDAGFLDYARHLSNPAVGAALEGATPVTPIITHRMPSSQHRHYDRLARFPEGLVVLGDALCSFNPIYGQGMTTSALDAALLERCLVAQRRRHPEGSLRGLADQFRKQVAGVVATPWLLATAEDFRWPQTQGQKPPGLGLLHWYVARVLRLGTTDHWMNTQFLYVMNMLRGPFSLFAPRIVWRVLTAGGRVRPAPAPRPTPAVRDA